MDVILCPTCGASNPVEAAVCESCNQDLTAVKSVIDTANTYYNEALALAHSGKLDESIGQLEAAIALSAQNPAYHNLLGTVYAQKGIYSEAIRAWERSLALDPEIEKSYNNIEKARRMEAEAAEEQRRRPFLLAAIICGVLATVFLLSTSYFALRAFFKSRTIDQLNNTITIKQNELNELTGKYKSITENLPPDGLKKLLDDLNTAQKITEEVKRQNELLQDKLTQSNQARSTQLQSLQEQLKTNQAENTKLRADLEKINALQAVINQKDGEILNLQKQIGDLRTALQTSDARVADFKEKLVKSQETSESLRQSKEEIVAKLRQSNMDALENQRTQLQQLRDEIAKYERTKQEVQYVNNLAVEALKHIDNNEYELAMQNVQSANARVPDHAVHQYLKTELERILGDPVEQEIRRQDNLNRERQREQRKGELIAKNLKSAQDNFSKGNYDQAIDMARRILALAPSDSKDAELSKSLIQQAEEKTKEISLLFLEAKHLAAENKTKEAEAALKQVLKRAPNHAEAKELLKQIGKSSE